MRGRLLLYHDRMPGYQPDHIRLSKRNSYQKPVAIAYQMMKQNHAPGGMMGGKDEMEFYIRNGYYPSNAGITLEICFQDWALAPMAQKLGKTKDYDYFFKRSQGWINFSTMNKN